MAEFQDIFPRGGENTAYAQYFVGRSYLNMLSLEQVVIGNVTFEPGCRNHWHIHHARSGGGQILLCTAGRGYYQEWGKPARELRPGDVVNIPAGVKHWHGAAPDSWVVGECNIQYAFNAETNDYRVIEVNARLSLSLIHI